MKSIQRLKLEARRIYVRYKRRFGEFSCGGELAEYISIDLQRDKDRFNKIMIQLEKIDPHCPKGIKL